jgi:hypothetical protein
LCPQPGPRLQDTGGYAKSAHRIHVPLLTNPDVSFELCPGSASYGVDTRSGATDLQGVGAAKQPVALPTAASASAVAAAAATATPLLAGRDDAMRMLQARQPGSKHLPAGPSFQLQANAVGSASNGAALDGCVRVEAPEGLVFELNNRVPHRVSNRGASERVHLVIDVSEAPRPRVKLVPGAACRYSPLGMECDQLAEDTAAGEAAADQVAAGPDS